MQKESSSSFPLVSVIVIWRQKKNCDRERHGIESLMNSQVYFLICMSSTSCTLWPVAKFQSESEIKIYWLFVSSIFWSVVVTKFPFCYLILGTSLVSKLY